MGRIAFYCVNATGLYLVMSAHNYEDEGPTRTIMGFILIGIGTLGILAINFWPRKRTGKPGETSSETEQSG